MSTNASTSFNNRNSLLRSIALGGMFIFITQFVHQWITTTLIQKTPFIFVWQYIASGALGPAALDGRIATALLGVFFHLIISFVIAGVFILGADRIALLRRYAIDASFLYGLGVFIVMNMIVIPLSAAPPLPAPTMPWLIEAILEHIVIVGLPLGILVRRNPDTAQILEWGYWPLWILSGATVGGFLLIGGGTGFWGVVVVIITGIVVGYMPQLAQRWRVSNIGWLIWNLVHLILSLINVSLAVKFSYGYDWVVYVYAAACVVAGIGALIVAGFTRRLSRRPQ